MMRLKNHDTADQNLHASLCGNFNTPSSMRVLTDLIDSTNKYMFQTKPLAAVKEIAKWVTQIVTIFGSAPNRPRRLSAVRSGQSNCRTAVFGPGGGPYRVRHMYLGQGGWQEMMEDGRGGRGTAGDSTNDVSWCYMIGSEVNDFNFG